MGKVGFWLAWMAAAGAFVIVGCGLISLAPKYRSRVPRANAWALVTMGSALLLGPVIALLGLDKYEWLDQSLPIVQIALIATAAAVLLKAHRDRKARNRA